MITTIPVSKTVEPRLRSGMGAFPFACAQAAVAASPRAVSARPSNDQSARIVMSHVDLALLGLAARQPDGQVPTYMTRTSATSALRGTAGGGAVGPHPAREPEPV